MHHLLWIPLFIAIPFVIIGALVWFDQGFSPVEGEEDDPEAREGGKYAKEEVPF